MEGTGVKHTKQLPDKQLELFEIEHEVDYEDYTGEKRVCKVCEKEKPMKMFHKSGVAGFDSRCSPCSNLERNWRRKERPLFEHLNTGLCACCGKESEKSLQFDHDHTTLKFRGFLCMHCNQGIGKLGDNIEGLETALRYLKKHEEENL